MRFNGDTRSYYTVSSLPSRYGECLDQTAIFAKLHYDMRANSYYNTTSEIPISVEVPSWSQTEIVCPVWILGQCGVYLAVGEDEMGE
jgi:hypothetical protein